MRLGVLGGSFNPVHNGHLRIALEVMENLDLQRVEFVPAPRPPHKSGAGLMPFEFRVELLQLALEYCPGLEINLLEANRSGVSYTYHTLLDYNNSYCCEQLFFILGSNDLFSLPQWYKWRLLPELTSFAVVGRQGQEQAQVKDFIQENFPFAYADPARDGFWRLNPKCAMIFVQMPRLDISSSLLRLKLAKGLSISYLVPEKVEARLQQADYQQMMP